MPVPLTIGTAVIDEANALLERGILMASDDFKVKQLRREAEKLVKENAAEAYSAMAILAGLTGDASEALRLIDNAMRLGNSPIYALNKCAILGNLGRFSEAQAVYRELRLPIGDAWFKQVLTGFNSGAFDSLAALVKQAEKMNIDTHNIDRDLITQATRTLNEAGLAERDVAGYLDIAGEIMHEERLIFLGAVQIQPITSSYETIILITLALAVDAFKAEQLDSELARRTAERIDRLSAAITVGFKSGLPDDERYPAGSLEALATVI